MGERSVREGRGVRCNCDGRFRVGRKKNQSRNVRCTVRALFYTVLYFSFSFSFQILGF